MTDAAAGRGGEQYKVGSNYFHFGNSWKGEAGDLGACTVRAERKIKERLCVC
jgi:hypothetical protein